LNSKGDTLQDLNEPSELDSVLAEGLASLYQKLMSENKPLEPEFQKII
jgi:hypothetical protein